jgi:hypothetical protein
VLWANWVGRAKKSWCYKERDEAEREAWVKVLEAVAVRDRVYVDETGCDDCLQREYGWSERGEPCFDRRVGHASERFSVVAAWQSSSKADSKADSGLVAPLSFDGTCHHRLFELWLRVMLCPVLRAGQVVILDNARFHRQKTVQRILKRVGCRALFLPAYSPDLNPIEKQWHAFKTRVCKHRLHGMSLKDAVDAALA